MPHAIKDSWFSDDRIQSEHEAADRDVSESITRAFDVLRAFDAAHPVLAHSELMRRTALPKATVSRLTHTLTRLGYLEYLPDTRRYRLGLGMLAASYPLTANLKLRHFIRPWLKELSEATGGTVSIATRWRTFMMYLEVHIGHRAASVQPEVGATVPILETAIGRGWMVGQSEARQTEVLNLLKVNGSLTDPGLQRLERAGVEFRERGFVIARGEYQKGIHAVSAPLGVPVEGHSLVFGCGMPVGVLGKRTLEADVGPLLRDLVSRVKEELIDPPPTGRCPDRLS
ncbi:MAG TPA: IclR family transcriptional regulator [Burkholderiaceae bacterium]|nr:IclR family transcriptional regulator [Burkholderiaceae bacterium]